MIDARLMAMDDGELDALRERFERLLAVAEIAGDADTRAIAREAIAGLRQFRAFVRPRARAAAGLSDPTGAPGAATGST